MATNRPTRERTTEAPASRKTSNIMPFISSSAANASTRWSTPPPRPLRRNPRPGEAIRSMKKYKWHWAHERAEGRGAGQEEEVGGARRAG
eukprot:8159332-Pyramimonas_sp.AAC.1